MFFASDNTAGAHPKVLEGLTAANAEVLPAYGDDRYTSELQERLREIFDHEKLCAFPIATGSSGNALALATLTPPWGAVYCHNQAHIHVDECAAPEVANPGTKLITIAGQAGKLTGAAIAKAISGRDFVHAVQPATVSLTNLTEVGTAYSAEDLAALGSFCRSERLALHLDGARFANALVTSNASPAQMSWRAGVDALTFGATKNGCLAAEVVVFFDPDKGEEFAFRRKRAGHLFSKMRFLSAQLLAYLQGDLWLETARHANAMAAQLAQGLTAAGCPPYFPVGGNMIFAPIPEASQARLRAAGALFYPGRLPNTDGTDVRLVTAWSTTQAEVDRFLDVLSEG